MASISATNPDFANRAWRFASGTGRRQRALLLIAGGVLVAVAAGPFGTGQISPLSRTAFWLTLLVVNFALWESWFTLLGRRGWPWRRSLFAGLVPFLLALPFEVDLALRVFAGTQSASHFGVMWRGAAIAGVLALAILLFAGRPARPPNAAPRFPGTAVKLDDIAYLTAEDHYVRLHLTDGSEQLLHRRFTDAVAAMSSVAGERINRGIWVADAHRGPAAFRRRRWFIRAGPALELPVSRTHAPRLRDAGWLAP